MRHTYLGSTDAAAYLGVTRQRLDELALAGRVKRIKIGRTWAYPRSALDAFRAAPKRKAGRPKSQPLVAMPAALGAM